MNYPWQDWFDGEMWELRAGRDFFVPVRTFQSIALVQARRMGIIVSVKYSGDNVFIQRIGQIEALTQSLKESET